MEENEIERPQDIVVRSAANKSQNKIYIIRSIDKQMPLDDIARGKGLEMSELITEMEHIISSGTKLNIDYYINANYEQDHLDALVDFWRDSENDSIEDAIDEFIDSIDSEYTEEEVRLMHIKFLSDFGH